MKKLFEKYKEIIMYFLVGGCTTVVSLATYFVFANILNLHYQIANILSWVFAVIFAYFTNKKFVFKSEFESVKNTTIEAGKFVSCRLASLLAEVISMYVLVQIFGIDDNLTKLINQFIVFVLNYIFSKFLVFRN